MDAVTRRSHRAAGLLAPLLALTLAGCAHKRLDPGDLREVHTVAIVARVVRGPLVLVAQADPAANTAFPKLAPEESDRKLAAALAAQVKRWELQERLRAEVSRRLPDEPPWSRALPAVEVATALDSLLVVDKSEGDPSPIDEAALKKAGADSILELRVDEFGVRYEQGKTGMYLKGKARLWTIDGSTLWKMPLDQDDAADPAGEPLELATLKQSGFHDAVTSFIGKMADRVATELAPKEAGPKEAPAAGPAAAPEEAPAQQPSSDPRPVGPDGEKGE